MDTWSAIGVFLLGAGAGALLTRIFYSSQIDNLKRLLKAASGDNSRVEQAENTEFEGRKSA
jgi:hypothetical protein